MNVKLKLDDVPEALRKTPGAHIKDIHHVNWNPHPFMIGGRHVSEAADHHGGILGQEVVNKIPCAMPRCNLMYDEHKCDTVAFIEFTADIQNEALRQWLLAVGKEMEPKGLDGFAFLENPYRILKEDHAPANP